MSEIDTTGQQALARHTAEAQEQADEFGGFAGSGWVIAPKTGEKFRVRTVLMLDDDELVAYERLHFEMNQCDRWPDVEQPMQRFLHKNPDGTEVETETGARTERGDFMQPYQKDGVRIDPPYTIQLAQIVLGDEEFRRYRAGGGRSADVAEALKDLSRAVQERLASDPKSAGSDGDVASGANGDRG